jgi:hypothetical protein
VFDSSDVGRILVAIGLVVLGVGIVLALGWRIPLGRLPGDFSGSRGNVTWSFPLGTSLLLSLVLTVLLNLLLRR